jgi:ribosome-associated toxin RatA of RatAB toxin-antitoxin module
VNTQSETSIVATLKVAKGSFHYSFTTQNTFDDSKKKITMALVEGPFSHLSGEWHFKRLSKKASKIELCLDFEFNNHLIELAFSKVMHQLLPSMLHAFIQQAEYIYSDNE